METLDPYTLDLPVGYYTVEVSSAHHEETYTTEIAIVPDGLENATVDQYVAIHTDYRPQEVVKTVLIIDDYCSAIALPDGQDRCYHIPKIVADSCDAFNKKIMSYYYDQINTHVNQCLQNYTEMYFLQKMTYTAGQRDNLVSIVMCTERMEYNFDVYNISLLTGEEVAAEQILALYGLTQGQFETEVRKFYEKRINAFSSEYITEEFIEYTRRETLSEKNISAAIPFIGPEGQLCFLATEHMPAGSGRSSYLVDLQTGEPLRWGGCETDHSGIMETMKRELTKDEAYLAACEFWGVTPQEAKAMEPEIWIAGGDIENHDGSRYYKFYLRQLTSGGSASTLDIVFVNALSGQASWSPGA